MPTPSLESQREFVDAFFFARSVAPSDIWRDIDVEISPSLVSESHAQLPENQHPIRGWDPADLSQRLSEILTRGDTANNGGGMAIRIHEEVRDWAPISKGYQDMWAEARLAGIPVYPATELRLVTCDDTAISYRLVHRPLRRKR